MQYKHKTSTSKIVNDVNCLSFIIVHFCIPLTSFDATWHDTHVCNHTSLNGIFSSRCHITKHVQYLEYSYSPRCLWHNFLFPCFLFYVLTLFYQQNDVFSFHHMPHAVCKTFLKRFHQNVKYCKSGNFRENLIFANIREFDASRK